jgi:hypothetical protein
MIVTGMYENGTVRLAREVRLKHDRVPVTVEIPDEELTDAPTQEHPDTLKDVSNPEVRSMMQDIRAIRQTSPGPGSGFSDRELLQYTYTHGSGNHDYKQESPCSL